MIQPGIVTERPTMIEMKTWSLFDALFSSMMKSGTNYQAIMHRRQITQVLCEGSTINVA